MMKKILLTFLLLSAVGCSFSKKSAEEKAQDAAKSKARTSVDEVVGDQRYTIPEKLESAILKQDKELFTILLKQISPQILNMSVAGKTLGERAVDTGDLFFVKGLIEAGMSPYQSRFKYRYGLAEYANVKQFNEARDYIYRAIDNLLHQATTLCLVSDIESLTSFMEENLISPVENVCGTMSLFTYYLSYRSYDSSLADKIFTKYISQNRSDQTEINQALLLVAFTAKSESLWKKISDMYEFSDLRFYGREFEHKINNSTLESVLENYLFVRKITAPELLGNIRFYVRAKVQMTDVSKDFYLQDLISKVGLEPFNNDGLEVPFKDRDCNLPKQRIVLPIARSADEEPPPPGEKDRNDPRLCEYSQNEIIGASR